MQPAQLSASFPLTNSVEDCTVVSGCQAHSLLQNPYDYWHRSPDTGSLDIWDLQSLAVKPLWQIEFEIKWFESMPMCSLASERHLSSQSTGGFLILAACPALRKLSTEASTHCCKPPGLFNAWVPTPQKSEIAKVMESWGRHTGFWESGLPSTTSPHREMPSDLQVAKQNVRRTLAKVVDPCSTPWTERAAGGILITLMHIPAFILWIKKKKMFFASAEESRASTRDRPHCLRWTLDSHLLAQWLRPVMWSKAE